MNKGKELAKNTIILTIGKICTQFLSFFLMPLYTAVLSTEEYGTVDVLLTYTSLLLPLIFFQLDQALFRFLIDVREKQEEKETIFSTILLFAILQSAMAILIFGILHIFISNNIKWFLLFNVISTIASSLMLQTSRGVGDNTTYAMGSFISAISQIVGNIVFLLWFKWGVAGMLVATILGHIIAAFFVFIKLKLYRYFFLNRVNLHTLKQMLKYSIPLIPNALCWWVLNAADRTIVLSFLGVASNGLLSVGHKFSSIYITIYNIFNLSWTESASIHMNDDDRDTFFTSVITNMFKLFMCAGIGLIAIMQFLFPLLVNSKFNEAYGLVPFFVLASMMNVIVGLYSVIYVALRKTEQIAKTSLGAGIINVIAHLFLIKYIDIYAAPISSAIAFGTMAVYRYFDLKKYVDVPLKKSMLLLFAILYIVITWIYMFGNMYLQVISLMIVIILSVLLNRNMIFDMWKWGSKVVGKRK